jgi:hypothetical protein
LVACCISRVHDSGKAAVIDRNHTDTVDVAPLELHEMA